MLKYITETEYKELLGKDSIPNDFNNLVIKASSYINYNTHGRIDEKDVPEQVKYTTCLIIDLIDEEDLEYYDEDDDLFEDLEDLEDLEYYEEEDDDDDDDDEKPDNIINLFKDDDLPF